MRFTALWMVVLGACSGALGLDEVFPDSDGDTMLDDVDRCPGFDDRLDEDGDGVPNGCDNCPAVENPGQENADVASGDNVGDACDPDPPGTCTVHTRAVFESFDDAGSQVWAVGTGSWAIEDGALVQQDAAARAFAHAPSLVFNDVVVRTQVTLEAYSSDTDDRGPVLAISTAPRGTGFGDTGYLCFANTRGTDHDLRLKRREGQNEITLKQIDISGQLALGSEVILEATSVAAIPERTCNVRQPAPPAQARDRIAVQDSTYDGGEISLGTERTHARFLSVEVIEIGATCP